MDAGTESIAKEICVTLGRDADKVKKLTLGLLVKEFEKVDEVEGIHRLLATIVPMGNYASHDQSGRQSEVINEELTRYFLAILEIAIKHFESWKFTRSASPRSVPKGN
ncbi:hypothetical protein [Boseongicola aestuarii]|uniref:DUF4145 domain-containing protein n=1 Tax=Boseongicola aestuarii TaxID=1470561 RepID=A0A238J3X8_9RHOB|nr:hypothetical protein [Boseongicola aestuarii]SMX25043.1 hypothetical protein BOA8489_03177 [Boseongicola aestuarii]